MATNILAPKWTRHPRSQWLRLHYELMEEGKILWLRQPHGVDPTVVPSSGAQNSRVIMGDDEASLLRLWREKRGEVEPEDLSGNLVVQLGTVTEDLNRHWYERNTNHLVTAVQRHVRHPVNRWMGATLDGMVEGIGAVFEAKFMLPWSFSEEAAAGKHMAQLQHNMWVTNAKASVLSIITGGGKWIEIALKRESDTRKRNGAAGTGDCSLSRSSEGANSRSGATLLGPHSTQPKFYTLHSWTTRRWNFGITRSDRSRSRSSKGTEPGPHAARVGAGLCQSWQRSYKPWRTRGRYRSPQRGHCCLWRGIEGIDT